MHRPGIAIEQGGLQNLRRLGMNAVRDAAGASRLPSLGAHAAPNTYRSGSSAFRKKGSTWSPHAFDPGAMISKWPPS